MATYKQLHNQTRAKSKPNKSHSASAIKNTDSFSGNSKLLLMLVLAFTFVVYFGSLRNQFIVNWDDGGYIHEHELVHDLTLNNVITIFNPTTFYKGNYHPLTTFIYAIEYAMVGESPFLYHLINLLFHLLNVFLVFKLVQLLSKRLLMAAFAALLFGIHPMHVESVAWISELKDVLYTFFFLLALLQYYHFIHSPDTKKKSYVLMLVFFFLSLLSKSAATIFPMLLFLLDYFFSRKFSFSLVLEKVPFFILSLVFGILAILSQDASGAIHDLGHLYSWSDKLLIVSHSVFIYLWKVFLPINLAAMHPYPAKVNDAFPLIYYLAPFIIGAVFTTIIFLYKRSKVYIFGLGFFLINIALVLQILSVGGASHAERYTYVPYIGIFYILGFLYDKGIATQNSGIKKLKPLIHLIVFGFILFLSILSWSRISKWYNGESLMKDQCKVYPNITFGYSNLGYYYKRWEKNFDKAIIEYNKALAIDSTHYESWSNLGLIFNNQEKHELAIKYFDKCLQYKPDNIDALKGRGGSYSALKKFDLAIFDYTKYLKLEPDDAKAHLWLGIAKINLNQYKEAIPDLEKSIALDSTDYEPWMYYAIVNSKMNLGEKSLRCYENALRLNDTNSEIYSWRGLTYYSLKMYDKSIQDYTKAISLNPNDAAAYMNRSIAYFETANYEQAWQDINIAGKMGLPLNKEFYLKVQAKIALK